MTSDVVDRIASFYQDALGEGRSQVVDVLFAENYLPQVPQFRGIAPLPAGRVALQERLASLGRVPHRVARILTDGNMAFAHVQYPGVVAVAAVDVFQFNGNGRISKHWNVRQPLPQGGSGDDRFATDKAHEITEALDPAWLKTRVRAMLSEVWSKGDAKLVGDFYDESYVQHNAEMPGGFSRIREIVQNDIPRYIELTGGPFPINVHHMVAHHDLVGVHLSIFMAGINRDDGARSTNVDIFRVNRAGRMVEHWDVLQIDGVALPSNAVLF